MNKEKSLEILKKYRNYIKNASEEEIDVIKKAYIEQLKEIENNKKADDNYFEIFLNTSNNFCYTDYSINNENFYKESEFDEFNLCLNYVA